MPLRIMHVVDNLGMGGLQNGLANLVARLDGDRFEHILCAVRPVAEADAQPFAPGRAHSICIDPEGRGARLQAPALARAMREYQPDIVHSRNWAAIESVFAGRWLGGAKLIHSEHGVDSGAAREPWRRSRLRRLAFELADQVMTVSYHLRELHAKRTGFDPSRIAVIHNGVDTSRFAPRPDRRAEARRDLGLDQDEFTIGVVGNLTPVKDHMTVLRALEVLGTGGRKWRVVFIGDGPEAPRLNAFVAAHPEWAGRIQFLGRSQRVAALLNAMDVYVLSSVTEGICNSLLEAMAAGLAPVVTATGGNPEVVGAGEAGMLFGVGAYRELAAALARLRHDEEMRARLAEAALDRVRNEFSLQNMIGRYEQLYERFAPRAHVLARVAVGG